MKNKNIYRKYRKPTVHFANAGVEQTVFSRTRKRQEQEKENPIYEIGNHSSI